jgi:serine/threonine protein kinase
VTPERWRQLTAIFHDTRSRPAEDRQAFLDRACGEDTAFRVEVEALLGAHDATGSLLHVDEPGPVLSLGAMFGVYRIDSVIGAGGMGQVYRATDTQLHRPVALKVILPDHALDAGFAARFDREGRALAPLNDPHIAAIYDVADAGGVRALVLELVEGPTLQVHRLIQRRREMGSLAPRARAKFRRCARKWRGRRDSNSRPPA